jgi:hypothetical protein
VPAVPKWSRKAEIAREMDGLALTAEEGFVLSRLDTGHTRDQVVELTGLAPARVEQILALLEDKGLVVSDVPSMRPIMATIPDAGFDGELPGAFAEPADDEATTPSLPPSAPSSPPSMEPPPWSEPPPRQELELDPNLHDPTFRKLYDLRLRALPLEKRIALAGRQTREALFALCLDPEPVVIRAVLMNPELVRSHARVIALNHADPSGLELLASTRDLLEDAQVEWLLLRNAHLPTELATRILAPKGLNAVFDVWVDEGAAESARAVARELVRARYATAPAEERAAIIWGTEGSVLPALAGLTLDTRTVTVLCSRSYTSIVFVRNILKFGACPAMLLGYLSKQGLVRRNPQLKSMLLAHPNTPQDVKRRG